METDEPRLFDEWIANWSDLVSFEVIPIVSSAEAAAETAPAVGANDESADERQTGTSLKLGGADTRQTPTVIVDHVINQRCRVVGRQQTVAHGVAEDGDRRRRAEADGPREERRVVVVDGDDVAVRLRDDDRRRLAEVTTVTRSSAEREPYALVSRARNLSLGSC